jgi:hypothetical protein
MAEKTYAHRLLLDKLGVREGARVSVVGIEDRKFLSELRTRTRDVSRNKAKPETDMVFLGVDLPLDMAAMSNLRGAIKPDGAVWVVFRKGRKDFNENDVLRLGLETGLVDVKVVRFSETHSALKFVIRKAERPDLVERPHADEQE